MTATRTTTGDDRGIWQYDLLFSIGSASWLIHFCVTSLTALVLALDGFETWIAIWYPVMILGTGGLAQLSHIYRRTSQDARSAARFGLIHGLFTGAIGLNWGIGALFAATDSNSLLFYTLVLGGTALGAVSSQHARLPNCLLSIWTSVPLLAVAQILPALAVRNIAASAMILLFGTSLSVMAVRLHGFLAENKRINGLLARQNAHLEQISAELSEAQNVRLRFLAQASHDLRQPIHAIGLFVECLKGARLNRDGRELLSRVDRSLGALARLCRSLLDVSALDVGRVVPQYSEFPLSDVIGDVARQAEETARGRNVRLCIVPTGLWIRTDPALLHNMLQNLVSNAIKYAPDGKVLIGARRVGGRIAIDVIDQGPGLSSEEQRRIFDEFVRLDTEMTAQTEGLGLGLSIVRRLAQTLGIALDVSSRQGHGTRFRIGGLQTVLPKAIAARPVGYESQLTGMNVFVVDDDEDVRESTAQMLSRWGCNVQASERFPDADAAARMDFLICDQELGDQRGLDMIRRLFVNADGQVRAVIITGADSTQLKAQAAADRITVLSKPIRPAQLRSLLLAARTQAHSQINPLSAATPAAAARDDTPRTLNRAET